MNSEKYREAKRGRGERPVTPASEELTKMRTRLTETRAMSAEMLLAKAREELVERRLVEKQTAYLLVSLRQRILTVPSAYARRILNLGDLRQAKGILTEAMLSLLHELQDLPAKVTNPHWLQELESEERRASDRGRKRA